GRVERLEHDQDGVAAARVEALLPVAEVARGLLELLGPVLGFAVVLRGLRRAVGDPERVAVRHEKTMRCRVEHGAVPYVCRLDCGVTSERPADVLADETGRVLAAAAQRVDHAGLRRRVAERDGDVPEPAVVARAPQRAAGRALAPRGP